jgi:hypothetical protein
LNIISLGFPGEKIGVKNIAFVDVTEQTSKGKFVVESITAKLFFLVSCNGAANRPRNAGTREVTVCRREKRRRNRTK